MALEMRVRSRMGHGCDMVLEVQVRTVKRRVWHGRGVGSEKSSGPGVAGSWGRGCNFKKSVWEGLGGASEDCEGKGVAWSWRCK